MMPETLEQLEALAREVVEELSRRLESQKKMLQQTREQIWKLHKDVDEIRELRNERVKLLAENRAMRKALSQMGEALEKEKEWRRAKDAGLGEGSGEEQGSEEHSGLGLRLREEDKALLEWLYDQTMGRNDRRWVGVRLLCRRLLQFAEYQDEERQVEELRDREWLSVQQLEEKALLESGLGGVTEAPGEDLSEEGDVAKGEEASPSGGMVGGVTSDANRETPSLPTVSSRTKLEEQEYITIRVPRSWSSELPESLFWHELAKALCPLDHS